MSHPIHTSPSGPLDRFHDRLAEASPSPASLQPLLRELEAAGLLEVALESLKRTHGKACREKGQGWGAVRARMEVAVTRLRDKRMATWQLDPRRREWRLRFAVEGPAAAIPSTLQVRALAQAFLEAGLPLAMGMEKTPRPMLTLAAALPLGVPGRSEWADACLRAPSPVAPAAVPAALAPHLPEGFQVLEVQEVPLVSSPSSERCTEARWSWPCPPHRLEAARETLTRFLEAEQWIIEKVGKVDGQKAAKPVDLRPLVRSARWEDSRLHLATRLSSAGGLSTPKLLLALLDLTPEELEGLVREAVILKADPRLANAYRFETKLSNLYEDAVLLETDTWQEPTQDGDEDDLLQL